MPASHERLVHSLQRRIFKLGGFQSMIDRTEQRELERAMGFHGQWDEHRRFQLELLRGRGLAPGHRLLEIGCGPLTAGLPLIRYLDPGHYTGVDVRGSVLDLAWRQIGKANLSGRNPRLICSGRFGEELLGDERFQFIHSFSVLFHLDDDVLDACLGAVRKRLAPDGQFIANVNIGRAEGQWLQFPFVRRTLETYRSLARRHGLDMHSPGTLADLGFARSFDEAVDPLLVFTHGAERGAGVGATNVHAALLGA